MFYATWISQNLVFHINIEYESSIALISVNNKFSHIIYFKNTFKYINTDTYVQWCNCFDFFFRLLEKNSSAFKNMFLTWLTNMIRYNLRAGVLVRFDWHQNKPKPGNSVGPRARWSRTVASTRQQSRWFPLSLMIWSRFFPRIICT